MHLYSVAKILKMIATSGFLTAVRCTKSFSAEAQSPTPLGEIIAFPRPLAGLRGPTSKGSEGEMGKKKGEEREGK